MTPTTQAYYFETQVELDEALDGLGMFSEDQYQVIAAGGNELLLHVWFADVETVMVPFCKAVWPE